MGLFWVNSIEGYIKDYYLVIISIINNKRKWKKMETKDMKYKIKIMFEISKTHCGFAQMTSKDFIINVFTKDGKRIYSDDIDYVTFKPIEKKKVMRNEIKM